MKKTKISIVIPVYQPDSKVFEMQREMLKKQTLKAEIVINENLPQAISFNKGIKKAKGDIIITLAQDCVPETRNWLKKLVYPLLKDKNVVAAVSDLILPEWYWKKYPFMTRMTTMKDIGKRRPNMDARACAFRKKDLIKARMFNENPNVVAIDQYLYNNLKNIGKIVHPNVSVFHLHPLTNMKKLKLDYKYAKEIGRTLLNLKFDDSRLWIRIIRAVPILGILAILPVFPFKKYGYYFPAYVLFSPIQHIMYLAGFWKGFLMGDKN